MSDISYNEIRDNRTKINNLVFTGSGGNQGDKIRCKTCIEHWALILKEIDGVKKWWCHGCGQTIPFEAGNSESGKYRSKY